MTVMPDTIRLLPGAPKVFRVIGIRLPEQDQQVPFSGLLPRGTAKPHAVLPGIRDHCSRATPARTHLPRRAP